MHEENLQRKKTRGDKGQIGWAVVGSLGAIEFWLFDPPFESDYECGGVEMHRRVPFSYQDASSKHDVCDVLDGDTCYHDGTSLWANEYWIPGYRSWGEEWVYIQLELYYLECLKEDDNE